MIRPLHDRIIIKRAGEELKTASGILIPDNAREKPQKGEVVAVGGGKRQEDGSVMPMDIKVGDNIIFGKYAGTEVRIDGEDYLMMKEDDVMAVVE